MPQRTKKQKQIEQFREENMSHASAEEFLRLMGENPAQFDHVFLSVAYVRIDDDKQRLHRTELELARIAMSRGCKYVTNIDYCRPCIAANGLRPKSSDRFSNQKHL